MRTLRGAPKTKKKPPYEFILDELSGLDVQTRRMFGCTAVYVGDKIVFVMYKPDRQSVEDEINPRSGDGGSGVLDQDIGIWVCIPNEHTVSMKKEFPQLRGVSFFPDENSAWQCLPEEHPDFEVLALKFCSMVKKGDPRIGRLPKPKKKKPVRKTPPARRKK